MDVSGLGKTLVLIGGALAAIGAVVWLLARLGFRGLPGDIRVESAHTTFYFPIVTCVVLSLLVSLGFWILRLFQRK